MASSVKRERSLADESPSFGKKPRAFYYGDHSLVGSSLHPVTSHRVVLNPADCDLDFNIEGNGLKGSALSEDVFAYCWSGARANIGITGGKYYFSCKIVSTQPVQNDEATLDQKHNFRIGISTQLDKVGNLGESEHSFGFSGTGEFSNNGKLSNYGERFNIGDIIVCAVDMQMGTIGFAKNGKWLGIAGCFNFNFNFNGNIASYFPHVVLKNVVVEMKFGYEDGLDGYRPWACAFGDGNGVVGPAFGDVRECELIMMVGLSGCGKTSWVERWVNEHPEKRYVVLGMDLALDKMKVPDLLRKQTYGEQFDRSMEHATTIFNTLLTRASRIPRNFIIDQANVYKSARKRKLKPFANFHKIAVVVFPRPEELKARSEKRFREMGKEVPAEAVNEMIANFVFPKSKDMPGTDEYFDQVIYIEQDMMESKRCLDEMKAKLQSHITIPPYSHVPSHHSYGGSNPVSSYPQEHLMQPHVSSTYPNSNKGRSLPRDDFNHRRSYSGYEHRASAPMGISDFYQKKSSYHNTPTHGTMDLSPRYSTTTCGGPQFDMHTPTKTLILPATSFPHGSAYGSPDPMNTCGNYTTHAQSHDGMSCSRYY